MGAEAHLGYSAFPSPAGETSGKGAGVGDQPGRKAEEGRRLPLPAHLVGIGKDQQPEFFGHIGCVHRKEILEFVHRHKTVQLERREQAVDKRHPESWAGRRSSLLQCLGGTRCPALAQARQPATRALGAGHTSLCTMSFPWEAMELL